MMKCVVLTSSHAKLAYESVLTRPTISSARGAALSLGFYLVTAFAGIAYADDETLIDSQFNADILHFNYVIDGVEVGVRAHVAVEETEKTASVGLTFTGEGDANQYLAPDPAGGHNILIAGSETFVTIEGDYSANAFGFEGLVPEDQLKASSYHYALKVDAFSDGLSCRPDGAYANISLRFWVEGHFYLLGSKTNFEPRTISSWSRTVKLAHDHGCSKKNAMTVNQFPQSMAERQCDTNRWVEVEVRAQQVTEDLLMDDDGDRSVIACAAVPSSQEELHFEFTGRDQGDSVSGRVHSTGPYWGVKSNCAMMKYIKNFYVRNAGKDGLVHAKVCFPKHQPF